MTIPIIYGIVILLVVGILFLVDKKVDKVQRPIILTPEDEHTNKILEKLVEIERMNHSLENHYDRS